MNAWAWDDFAGVAGGSWHTSPGDDALSFVGVSIDTRSIEPGQVFFAFIGEQVDGHDYLTKARDGGAGACVVTHAERVPDDLGIPVLVVKDPQEALTRLANAWREWIQARVIAITGSNGKTTACRLMEGVCGAAGKTHASPKSFNNALGVPITVLNTPVDAAYLVAEVGMSTPGEIAARNATLRPDVAIITSIGRAHLEGLGSIENIAKEKAQLISTAPAGAVGVIPGGIGVLEDALAGDPHRILRLDDRFKLETSDAHGCGFRIGQDSFRVALPGDHNASNAALCVLAGRELGINDDVIRDGLAGATPPAMRFERIQIATDADPIVVINDAYNANPDSMRAALATFIGLQAPGRKIAVLGEMLEVGETGPTEHRLLAEHATGLGRLDRVILLGASFASLEIDDPRVEVIHERSDKSIAAIAGTILPGDTVLIKGSRGVKLERLADNLGVTHASDRSNGKENAQTPA
ncbi:MAG: UDP-N-acetylmuramoyl-tripeptide--D-alanyl-D-alanine ligase [bacterium]|nr:UDP-N-acetylmuramoyl-tripeptide--D-alanyl-D-alanine ligase [bacterium]